MKNKVADIEKILTREFDKINIYLIIGGIVCLLVVSQLEDIVYMYILSGFLLFYSVSLDFIKKRLKRALV